MATQALIKPRMMPSLFEDFLRPWNEWFDNTALVNRVSTVPAVNITENADSYMVSLAAPGLKKDDFNIDIAANMLTISSEKEEEKEDKSEDFNRKEYSYTSFSRSFTLPEDVKQDAIQAQYQDGVLKITLPRKEEAKKTTLSKKIAVH